MDYSYSSEESEAGYSVDDIASQCLQQLQETIHDLATLNIIVVGKTGAGKSTLINSIFREHLAETGIGKPVTQHMRKLTKKNLPLVIYDTKGLELDEDVQKEVAEEIQERIQQGYSSNNINDSIHCIWYCINAASNRVEEQELELIRKLTEQDKYGNHVPVIVVLTQSFSKKKAKEMRSYIEEQNLDVEQVVPVLAQDYEIDDSYIVPAYGLDTLISIMTEVLPDDLLDTLSNLQKVSLGEKQDRARKAVQTATAAASAAAATPLPVSDCVALIPIQVTMIASIAADFGVSINKMVIASYLSSILGAGGATLLGRAVASSLIKLIPGAGTVGGTVISAGTAATFTYALGEAFIGIMSLIYKGEIDEQYLGTPEGKNLMFDMFQKQLKHAPAEE